MNSSLDNVQPGYDRWSLVYDHDANPLPVLEEQVMQRVVGDVRGLRVLDAGCGTGRHASWLQTAGALVTAIDFSNGMLAAARQKPELEKVAFHVHDLHQTWPFEDASFEVAISGLVLEHIQELPHFFSELRRVTVPTCKVALSTLHPSMFLRGSQARFTDPETGAIVQPGSINHSFSEMVMAALDAGFRIVDLIELAPDDDFARHYPRAEKYVGWPMLLVMALGGLNSEQDFQVKPDSDKQSLLFQTPFPSQLHHRHQWLNFGMLQQHLRAALLTPSIIEDGEHLRMICNHFSLLNRGEFHHTPEFIFAQCCEDLTTYPESGMVHVG